MDPSKRICLKNLPEGCTKREIGEMVRSRTGSSIHSIDLGEDAEGNTRRYCHFSCDGAKNVLEVLASTGCTLRGCPVQAFAANPHFSVRYAQARRKRESEELQEKEDEEALWTSVRLRLEKSGAVGEISATPKRLRSFYYNKQRYASVASEIAARCKEAYIAANGGPRQTYRSQPGRQGAFSQPTRADAQPPGSVNNNSNGKKHADLQVASTSSNGPRDGAVTASKKREAAPATPAPPPAPSKSERKLSGLQAKLALLKEKLLSSHTPSKE